MFIGYNNAKGKLEDFHMQEGLENLKFHWARKTWRFSDSNFPLEKLEVFQWRYIRIYANDFDGGKISRLIYCTIIKFMHYILAQVKCDEFSALKHQNYLMEKMSTFQTSFCSAKRFKPRMWCRKYHIWTSYICRKFHI